MECGTLEMAYLNGKLTKRLVENLGSGRHGDGNGLYLVVDPSGARRNVHGCILHVLNLAKMRVKSLAVNQARISA